MLNIVLSLAGLTFQSKKLVCKKSEVTEICFKKIKESEYHANCNPISDIKSSLHQIPHIELDPN